MAMVPVSRRVLPILGIAVLLACSASASADLGVVSLSPARHAVAADRDAPIVITFDRPVNAATLAGNFNVFARWSGPVGGAFQLSNGDQTVTFSPDRTLFAGEGVMVQLTGGLLAADGSAIQAGGYVYTYTTAARTAPRLYRVNDVMSARTTPGAQTRIYGGLACDVDRDSWCDLTLINEVSEDIRVFLNTADGSGLFQPFLQPPTQNEYEASPNEPADFNGDGLFDIATANTFSGTVSIHLGNGDGTFAPRQVIAVGAEPHGLAVLDIDGDSDLDIATSNTGGDNVSLLINNGAGVFSPGGSFDGGGGGEYALAAADMNNDGILDLVVGCRFTQNIVVHRCNGNGTFTQVDSRSAGGLTWMIQCGDVNGDGNMDVASANSQSNHGSILLGGGDGTLGPATVTPTANGPIASDLVDLDGDGDLDWVLSSFAGGEWRVFKNNGQGAFTFDQGFDAPSNPACCLVADIDNDGDMDLILLDEIADVMVIMESICRADWGRNGQLNSNDISAYLAAWLSSVTGGNTVADFNADQVVNSSDISAFISAWLEGIVNGC